MNPLLSDTFAASSLVCLSSQTMNYNQEISVKAADLSHLECSQTFFLLYIRITIKKRTKKFLYGFLLLNKTSYEKKSLIFYAFQRPYNMA